MSKDFEADLILGDKGESMWGKHLESKGHTVSYSEKTKPVYWDMKIQTGVSFEVKYDEKAWYWAAKRKDKTVNMFLECWNDVKNKKCGVMVLEADFLIYIIAIPDNRLYIAYIFKVKKLQEFLLKAHKLKTFPVKRNSVNGHDNVRGWVPSVSQIMNDEAGYMDSVFLFD